jgi:hypothetical protein
MLICLSVVVPETALVAILIKSEFQIRQFFIGFRYAMLAMKTILLTLLRHYRVVATTYTSISDIKLKFDVATKCVGGQNIQLEVRS